MDGGMLQGNVSTRRSTELGPAAFADLPQPNGNASLAMWPEPHSGATQTKTTAFISHAASLPSTFAPRTFARNRNSTGAVSSAAAGAQHAADSSRNGTIDQALKPLQLLLPLPAGPERRETQNQLSRTIAPAAVVTDLSESVGAGEVYRASGTTSATPYHLQLSSLKLQQASRAQRNNQGNDSRIMPRISTKQQQDTHGQLQRQLLKPPEQPDMNLHVIVHEPTPAGPGQQAPTLLEQLFPCTVPAVEPAAEAAAEANRQSPPASIESLLPVLHKPLRHPKHLRSSCKEPPQPQYASAQPAGQAAKGASKLQQRSASNSNAAVTSKTLETAGKQQTVSATFQLTRSLLQPTTVSSSTAGAVDARKLSQVAGLPAEAGASARNKGDAGFPAQQSKGSLLLPLPCRVAAAAALPKYNDEDLQQSVDCQHGTDSRCKDVSPGARQQHHQASSRLQRHDMQQEGSKSVVYLQRRQCADAAACGDDTPDSQEQPSCSGSPTECQPQQPTVKPKQQHQQQSSRWCRQSDIQSVAGGMVKAPGYISEPDSDVIPAGSSSSSGDDSSSSSITSEDDHPSDRSWSQGSSAADVSSGSSSSCRREGGCDEEGSDTADDLDDCKRSSRLSSRRSAAQKRKRSGFRIDQSKLDGDVGAAAAALTVSAEATTAAAAARKRTVDSEGASSAGATAADVVFSRRRRFGTDITAAIVNQQPTAADKPQQPLEQTNKLYLELKPPTGAVARKPQQQQQQRRSVSWAALPLPGIRPANQATTDHDDVLHIPAVASAVSRRMLTTKQAAKPEHVALGHSAAVAAAAAVADDGPDQAVVAKLPRGQVPLHVPSAAALARQNVLLLELPGCFEAAGDAGAIGRVTCSRQDNSKEEAAGAADAGAAAGGVDGGCAVEAAQAMRKRGILQLLNLPLGKTYDGKQQQKTPAAAAAGLGSSRDIPADAGRSKQGGAFSLKLLSMQQQSGSGGDASQDTSTYKHACAGSSVDSSDQDNSGQNSSSDAGSEDSSQDAGNGDELEDSREVTAVNLDLKGLIFSTVNLPLAGTAAVVRINMAGGNQCKASAHIEHLFNTSFIRTRVAAADASTEPDASSNAWACADADSDLEQQLQPNEDVYDAAARFRDDEDAGVPNSRCGSRKRQRSRGGQAPSRAKAGSSRKGASSASGTRGRRRVNRVQGEARSGVSDRKRAANSMLSEIAALDGYEAADGAGAAAAKKRAVSSREGTAAHASKKAVGKKQQRVDPWELSDRYSPDLQHV